MASLEQLVASGESLVVDIEPGALMPRSLFAGMASRRTNTSCVVVCAELSLIKAEIAKVQSWLGLANDYLRRFHAAGVRSEQAKQVCRRGVESSAHCCRVCATMLMHPLSCECAGNEGAAGCCG